MQAEILRFAQNDNWKWCVIKYRSPNKIRPAIVSYVLNPYTTLNEVAFRSRGDRFIDPLQAFIHIYIREAVADS